jgi:hypothetical protein
MANDFCAIQHILTLYNALIHMIGSILFGGVKYWFVSYDTKIIYRVNRP